MKPFTSVLLGLLMFDATTDAYSADTFKQLGNAEIRAKIVGNVVTDQTHWSDRFAADGILHEMSLGTFRSATWKLNGDQVCVTRKTRKPPYECFEIWASGDVIEYRRGGITLMTGVLRNN